jgi:steroid delta-isomerase-like uncharacterized protein
MASFVLLLGFVIACNTSTETRAVPENEATARALCKALDENDLEAFERLFAPECRIFISAIPDPISPDDLKALVPLYYTAFPDYTHMIEDVVSAGDKVVVRLTLTGTHEAEFEGIPPTGREIEYDQIAIFRFSEDSIVEAWAVEDNLTMMIQLGMQLVPGNADG